MVSAATALRPLKNGPSSVGQRQFVSLRWWARWGGRRMSLLLLFIPPLRLPFVPTTLPHLALLVQPVQGHDLEHGLLSLTIGPSDVTHDPPPSSLFPSSLPTTGGSAQLVKSSCVDAGTMSRPTAPGSGAIKPQVVSEPATSPARGNGHAHIADGGAEAEGEAEGEGGQSQSVAAPDVRKVFGGLRVRVGLHSGVAQGDVGFNSTSGRRQYVGDALMETKRVCDAGQGAMVLLSSSCFSQLALKALPERIVALHMGEFIVPRPSVPVKSTPALHRCATTGFSVAAAFSNGVDRDSGQVWMKEARGRGWAWLGRCWGTGRRDGGSGRGDGAKEAGEDEGMLGEQESHHMTLYQLIPESLSARATLLGPVRGLKQVRGEAGRMVGSGGAGLEVAELHVSQGLNTCARAPVALLAIALLVNQSEMNPCVRGCPGCCLLALLRFHLSEPSCT